MRKAALQLLTALLLYNPFGGELPEGRFEASLAEWKAKLQVTRTQLPILSRSCRSQVSSILFFSQGTTDCCALWAERVKSCAVCGRLEVNATLSTEG